MIPFNKISNSLRRSDEADPSNARLRPSDEALRGGFSAQRARSQRGAKSRRKASRRPLHSTRHMRIG